MRPSKESARRWLKAQGVKPGKFLAAGSFAVVFEGRRGRVLKVTTDYAAYEGAKVQHSLIPKLWRDFGEVGRLKDGRRVWAVEVQRVRSDVGTADEFYRKHGLDFHGLTWADEYVKTTRAYELAQAMREHFEALGMEHEVEFDLHNGNVRKDSKGCYKLIDPVYSPQKSREGWY